MMVGYLAGGGARNVLGIVRGLDNDRFRITVCYLKDSYSEEQNFLEDRFGELNVKVTRRVNLQSLYGFLQESRIDILHTHSPYSGILGRLVGKAAGVSIILSNQQSIEKTYSLKTRFIDQLTYPLADAVICVSNAVRESLSIAKRLFPRLISVIYNGIDISYVENVVERVIIKEKKKELGLKQDDLLIGNVARLSYEKDHRSLINAMEFVVAQRPTARLLIVGWGELEKELRTQVKRLGLQDNVLFLGHKEREEVLEILAILDVFVLSSCYEGFNLAILEAMAAQKPIVATNIGAFKEAVVDGETALLAQSGNPNALAEAILYYLNYPSRSKAMGLAGRKRVEQLFSSHVMTSQYRQLYEDLIKQKGLGKKDTSGNYEN
jgi:glycosyltransferase involved in cell wall biosynthesis